MYTNFIQLYDCWIVERNIFCIFFFAVPSVLFFANSAYLSKHSVTLNAEFIPTPSLFRFLAFEYFSRPSEWCNRVNSQNKTIFHVFIAAYFRSFFPIILGNGGISRVFLEFKKFNEFYEFMNFRNFMEFPLGVLTRRLRVV